MKKEYDYFKYYFEDENARPRKEDVEKTVISQNWKFAQLITGFSIGILAFSIQTLIKIKDMVLNQGVNFEYLCILIISLILLFIAFFFGLGRLHFLKKDIQKDYDYLANLLKSNNIDKKEELTSKLIRKNKTINCWNRACSIIMSYSFLFGILFYTVFLILNIHLVITN